jgi:hypothetical protein
MSDKNAPFNPFDPAGVLKNLRGAGLDAWSKTLIDFVNSDAYAQATATMLDAWLSTSAPFRSAVSSAMTQALAQLNLPSRADVISLAERLTNIELRLDDLEARLDEAQRPARKPASRTARPANGEGHS